METITGTLRSGMMGIGAEHSGWAVISHNEQGNRAAVELDVSGVIDDAKRLAGTEVRVSGPYKVVPYLERGPTKVMIVRKIEPADGN